MTTISKTYDVAVLGGGIVGVSAALRAALAVGKVALIEPGFDGKATSAGAGIVSPVGLGGNEASREWSELVASSIGHYQRLLELLREAGTEDVGYSRVGEVVLATREEDIPRLAELQQRLEAFNKLGVPIGSLQRVDATELRRTWTEMRDDLPGLYIENISRLDGRRMCEALGALARLRGVDFIQGQGRLSEVSGQFGLEVEGQPFHAGAIILATGAWALPTLDLLGTRQKVHPVRGQIVHLRVDDPKSGVRPVVNTFEGHYFLGFPDGRVVVGGTHEPEAGFDCRVTAGGIKHVLDKSLRIAPGLAAATHIETRVGLRPRSTDGYPIVGKPASAPNVVVATGLGAWGLTLGPLIGEIAAEQALGLKQTYKADFLGPDRQDITEAASLSLNI